MNAFTHHFRLPSFAHSASSRVTRQCTPVHRTPQWRWMSVTVLDDGEAVAKFRTVNPKSVLYFTATWCPPCKMISPIYATLSETYPNVAFGKVDIDDNQNSAADFKISAVPTFVFSRGEETVNKLSGADKVQLEKFVREL